MPVVGDDVPCEQCGRTPTRTLPIRRHVGMGILQRAFKVKQPLCRDHGTQLTKQFLGKTLVQGWWGLTSLFVNFWVVARDTAVLVGYRRLAPPTGLPGASTPGS